MLVFHINKDSTVSVKKVYFIIEQVVELNDLMDNQFDDLYDYLMHYEEWFYYYVDCSLV